MFALNNKNIIIIGVVGAVIVGGIYFYSSGGLKQSLKTKAEKEEVPQVQPRAVSSIAGRVTAVNARENSFVLLQPKEETRFTVKVGQNTEFIRLSFPFDVSNPPAGATFTPKREIITIEDLKENDQVFVRASSPIKTEQDIVDPLEVQVLP